MLLFYCQNLSKMMKSKMLTLLATLLVFSFEVYASKRHSNQNESDGEEYRHENDVRMNSSGNNNNSNSNSNSSILRQQRIFNLNYRTPQQPSTDLPGLSLEPVNNNHNRLSQSVPPTVSTFQTFRSLRNEQNRNKHKSRSLPPRTVMGFLKKKSDENLQQGMDSFSRFSITSNKPTKKESRLEKKNRKKSNRSKKKSANIKTFQPVVVTNDGHKENLNDQRNREIRPTHHAMNNVPQQSQSMNRNLLNRVEHHTSTAGNYQYGRGRFAETVFPDDTPRVHLNPMAAPQIPGLSTFPLSMGTAGSSRGDPIDLTSAGVEDDDDMMDLEI
eukprot:497344_1